MRVAVVGCGGAGLQHVLAYRAIHGLASLVGVCDVDAARAEHLAQLAEVPAYTAVDQLLTDARPDVVSVCTPESLHVDPALAGLRAGCHVFCEKPLAHSRAMAKQLIATAQSHGVVLGIDYNYRHIPAFIALQAAIAAGELGEVVLSNISAHAFCYHHAIDLVRFLFGEVGEVTAWIDDVQEHRNFPWDTPEEFLYVPSRSAAAVLRMRRGSTVVLTSSRFRELEDTLLDVEVEAVTLNNRQSAPIR